MTYRFFSVSPHAPLALETQNWVVDLRGKCFCPIEVNTLFETQVWSDEKRQQKNCSLNEATLRHRSNRFDRLRMSQRLRRASACEGQRQRGPSRRKCRVSLPWQPLHDIGSQLQEEWESDTQGYSGSEAAEQLEGAGKKTKRAKLQVLRNSGSMPGSKLSSATQTEMAARGASDDGRTYFNQRWFTLKYFPHTEALTVWHAGAPTRGRYIGSRLAIGVAAGWFCLALELRLCLQTSTFT